MGQIPKETKIQSMQIM